jgi:hypothetical protein
MQPPSINSAVSALRFFFTVMLDRPDPGLPHGSKPAPAQAGVRGPRVKPAN